MQTTPKAMVSLLCGILTNSVSSTAVLFPGSFSMSMSTQFPNALGTSFTTVLAPSLNEPNKSLIVLLLYFCERGEGRRARWYLAWGTLPSAGQSLLFPGTFTHLPQLTRPSLRTFEFLAQPGLSVLYMCVRCMKEKPKTTTELLKAIALRRYMAKTTLRGDYWLFLAHLSSVF